MTEIKFETVLADIVDLAEPKMDVYEFAIYMYLVRHTRLVGNNTGIFGFKSIRKTMVIGVGENNKPMSEGTCYGKIRSLAIKGFIEIQDSTNNGLGIKVFLPSEVNGLLKVNYSYPRRDIEEIDFFATPEYRDRILERDQRKCFYCFKKLSSDNYVIEHVKSRPEGDNSYRNLVACCRTCNNKKDKLNVLDFIRNMYRDGFISESEFTTIEKKLVKLVNGELKPEI